MRRKLAVALAGVFTLTAAPAAQAGWMTGAGALPVYRSDAVCSTHMDFQMATYAVARHPHRPSAQDGTTIGGISLPAELAAQPPLGLTGLGVWVVTPEGPVEPMPVVAPSDHSLPFRPLYVDPSEIGGAVFRWPGEPGQFTHSGRFTLDFQRRLPPGTRVRVAWGTSNPDASFAPSFTVGHCRGVGIVHEPGEPALGPSGP